MTEENQVKRLFALFYASCKNPAEAAVRAGITSEEAEKKGLEMLNSKSVKKMIKRFADDGLCAEEGVRIGLERLAFGAVNDVIEVVMSEEGVASHKIKTMNFFNVSEIKKVKGGGVEIKLFDRQKAMEKLLEIYEKNENSSSAQEFLSALKGAAAEVTEKVED